MILDKACTCGHDHRTHRDEFVHRCLECACDEEKPRCQNCGEEVPVGQREVFIADMRFDVCSRRCGFQIEHGLAVASSTKRGPQ